MGKFAIANLAPPRTSFFWTAEGLWGQRRVKTIRPQFNMINQSKPQLGSVVGVTSSMQQNKAKST